MVPKPVVVDIFVSLQRDQAKPVVEVRFDSVSGAATFRKAAAALAKAKILQDFASLFFSNSITQATRVRIEVMRAIAKKLTTTSETAFVQGFISRPVMRYVAKDPAVNYCEGTGRSYSYVDCVSRYGDLVQAHELSLAYKRAGSTFKGAMEQYFVLLNEDDLPGFSGVNRAPLGSRFSRGARGSVRGRKRQGGPPVGSPYPKKSNA